MKILMLCTFPHGGATIAARRQKDALRSIGYECDFASIKEDWSLQEIEFEKIESEISISVPANAWSYYGRITTAYNNNNRTDISNTWFSFWLVNSILDDFLISLCSKYDVIHLHWTSQMISSEFLVRLSKYRKRVIITSHDMSYFTGGCHYSANCDKYKTICDECPQLKTDPLNLVFGSFKYKIQALSTLQATWLFPSIWLADAFRASRLGVTQEAIKVIYNCIDVDRFQCISFNARDKVRAIFGFAPYEMVFVAGASDNMEQRKGFSYVEYAIKQLSENFINEKRKSSMAVIVTFGHGKPWIKINSPFVRHIHLGSINEAKIIDLFQSADLLIFPSVEENFSNTILESLMCGCPVLAFRIGGVPDIVTDQVNGIIVDNIDYELFASTLEAIADPVSLSELRHRTGKWHSESHVSYGYSYIADKLVNIYTNTQQIKKSSKFIFDEKFIFVGEIYPNIFKKSLGINKRDHLMLAANISQFISINKNHFPNMQLPEYEINIRAVYSGFGVEYHPEYGRIGWLKKNSQIFFKTLPSSRPAFCIRASNIGWIVDSFKKAINNLNATYNGKKAIVHTIFGSAINKHIFMWIVPSEDSLLSEDEFNTLSLNFIEASIPEEKDIRGLCLLHNHANLFDINALSKELRNELFFDYYTVSALILRSEQNHYVLPDWSCENNDNISLTNILDSWSDVINRNNAIL